MRLGRSAVERLRSQLDLRLQAGEAVAHVAPACSQDACAQPTVTAEPPLLLVADQCVFARCAAPRELLDLRLHAGELGVGIDLADLRFALLARGDQRVELGVWRP